MELKKAAAASSGTSILTPSTLFLGVEHIDQIPPISCDSRAS
jgi:hypothetical protein